MISAFDSETPVKLNILNKSGVFEMAVGTNPPPPP